MAELIVKFVPSIKKVRLCNSGTEATMSAIRLARGFTRRDKIIKFSGCYHGHSDSLLIKAGSGALTHGHADSAGVPAAFANETVVLSFNARADIMDLLAPLGPVYQAGTLSGNPFAMAAGIAALKLLEEQNPYARLDQLGRQLRDAVLAACRAKGLPVQVPQLGSMFSIFFSDTPVRDYATALKGDAKIFSRFFHACLE